MRVIVTGATGFIGQALTQLLAGQGMEVIALTRSEAKGRTLFGDDVRTVAWDGRTANGWGKWADGCHGIVNLAGESIASRRWSPQRKEALVDSRLCAGGAVVQAVKEASTKPKVVIQASGIGYYGDRGDEILDEKSTVGRGFLADLAAKWEPSTAAVTERGVRHVILRTSVVLGAKGGALPQMVRPYRMFAGGPLGKGTQWVSWIHLEDQINAIRFLLENENLRGPFNLTAPNPIRQRDFGKAIGRVIGRPSLLPTPAFALRLMLGEMGQELLLSGQRAMPNALLDAGYTFHHPKPEPALANLLE